VRQQFGDGAHRWRWRGRRFRKRRGGSRWLAEWLARDKKSSKLPSSCFRSFAQHDDSRVTHASVRIVEQANKRQEQHAAAVATERPSLPTTSTLSHLTNIKQRSRQRFSSNTKLFQTRLIRHSCPARVLMCSKTGHETQPTAEQR
jgi:hypothetical protein